MWGSLIFGKEKFVFCSILIPWWINQQPFQRMIKSCFKMGDMILKMLCSSFLMCEACRWNILLCKAKSSAHNSWSINAAATAGCRTSAAWTSISRIQIWFRTDSQSTTAKKKGEKKKLFQRSLITNVLQLCSKGTAVIIFLWNKWQEKLMCFHCDFNGTVR